MSDKVKYRPVGFKVLIEVIGVPYTSKSGIIIKSKEDAAKEQHGMDLGRIIAFGPTAFKGYEGCNSPKDWGVKVGDLVEFVRHNGKLSRLALDRSEFSNHRIINDSDIIGIIETSIPDEDLINR